VPAMRAIVAAAATLALFGGAGIAVTVSANAETQQCGSGCVELYGGLPGITVGHPSFIIASDNQGTAAGTSVILSGVSSIDPGEDFTSTAAGTVSFFYQEGLVTASLDQVYGDDEMYQFQYSPSGAPSGECIGVTGTAVAGRPVVLIPAM
jgi:hypothetical protein